ncbi:PTS beta-glucoside transporter subunit IIBCA [Enterococcus ratti]|uniref:PTS beta-glucoside transporter subunit IIBCA n=1 Tax=Enterococcus ratti TaxID=150033 RepID=UPI0035170E30
MNNYYEFNQTIIELVGGKENIEAVVHCMTRLRFTLKDKAKAQTNKLKCLEGVIDVVNNQVAYQIILGTHVSEVYKELMIQLELSSKEEVSNGKKNPMKAALDVISESMTPILEPIICAGLLAAALSIASLTGVISTESSTYQIFDALRSAVFYFLPILMAMSCSKRLGASPYLAVALAATILSSAINGEKGLDLFGIGLPQITYSNSFIPILLAIWFMGYVTKVIRKIVPQTLHYFLSPLLVMLITLPATLLVFGPLGFYMGEGIIAFFNLLMKHVGSWFVMMLYSALQPFIIMLGAGNFIMPVVASLIAVNGYDPAFISSCTISDIAVGGAMLGYFLKARNLKQKQLFGTVTLSAVLGVTEPAIYGVFVKYRRPFIAVMLGGGFGGLFAGLTGVKAYSIAWGLFGLPAYIGKGDFINFWFMLAAVAVSFIGSAVAAYVLGIPPQEESEMSHQQITEIKATNNLRTLSLGNVVEGEVIPLNEVKDQAFSTGALGKGLAIKPQNSHLYSPVVGEITAVFPTNHAIGIRSHDGVEILIHIGIDTVELEGKYFDLTVKQGDKVKKGQLIGMAEFDKIEKAGYDPTTIIVITNTDSYVDIIPSDLKQVVKTDSLLNVIL